MSILPCLRASSTACRVGTVADAVDCPAQWPGLQTADPLANVARQGRRGYTPTATGC
ncbi:MAG TPA: hypothetical protein VH540_08250 [Ktedonobacterales bacterium]